MKNRWMQLLVLAVSCSAPKMAALGQDKLPEYAGTLACTVCHQQEYDSWKVSKHAAAVSTNTTDPVWGKDGIGCEACHGPGQDHVAGGDPAKIVAGKEADICGQCHSSNATTDVNTRVAAFRPGMRLSDIQGLQLTPVDLSKIPPQPRPGQRLTYNEWMVSGHSKALDTIVNSGKAAPECYECHSAEGFAAKRQGKKADMAQKVAFHTLACIACHDPHNSSNPPQLVMDSDQLCSSCHSQRTILEGKGAKGIEDTRSFHSAVKCVSCHMSEGNHLMKVIRPDSPDLAESRPDTCTTCHRDNNREARAKQIKDWQDFYKEAMDPLQTDLQSVNAALKKDPDLLDAELKAKLSDLKSNLSLIIKDGSRGAHNLDYALEIMSLAASDLKEIKAAIQ